MKWLRSTLIRFRSLFHKEQLDRSLDAELTSHLELHIEDNLRAGMSPDEARRAALLKLGGFEQTKESVRDRRAIPTLDRILRDFRFGFRIFRKSPAFSALAILTLALGVGANTAIFTVVYATLLAPLPYPNPQQLVMVWSKFNQHRHSVSAADYLDWKRQSSVFQDLIALSGTRFALSSSEHPEVLRARITSPGFFDVQGIPLLLGRDFLPEEATAGRDHVVIMTHQLWQQRFAGNTHILGQQLWF